MLFKFRKLKKFGKSYKGFLVLLAVISTFFIGLNYEKIKSLEPAAVISASKLNKALLNKDFTLINVHTPYEGEISKTDLFIPFDEIMSNEAKLPKDKNAKIIVYCKSGNMSGQAARTLKSLGIKTLLN